MKQLPSNAPLVCATVVLFISVLADFGHAWAAKGPDPQQQEVQREAAPLYPYDHFYRGRGTDLVVRKVLFEQGEFGGRERIRYKVWISNICNQATTRRIKISLPFLSAIWIEGGIGPGETRASNTYFLEESRYFAGSEVVVDPDNLIEEIDEDNNSCTAAFSASDGRSETRCWQGGSRCLDPAEREPRIPGRPRMRKFND